MALKDDLESQVKDIFKEAWTTRKGQVVPGDASLKLNNDGINIEATILYADLSDSTKLVDSEAATFSAEIYKAFLRCAAKIIISEGGVITAYDGDRVMAVFLGDSKNSDAVRAGLKINWACKYIIQPKLEAQYTASKFKIKHVVGIDTSDILVARAGIRGSNDLVWIGRAANYAAKLSALDHNYPTWITKAVYDLLNDKSKFSGGVDMWTKNTWNAMNKITIYSSTYHWSL